MKFETPEPISVVIDVAVGDVRITADDRPDTVVEVRPSDPDRRADVTAAEQTRVEYSSGRLVVKTTQRWKSYSPFSAGGSVDVQIDLPAGSRVNSQTALAPLTCTGTLGDCRFKTALGEIRVDQTAALTVKSGAGDIGVERAVGSAQISTGTGEVRVGQVDGDAVIKNSNGDTRVGQVNGDLRVNAANGDIVIDQAEGSLAVKTAQGDIRLGAVLRGSVVAETGLGDVEIAIADGTAAWLDLDTRFGRLDNALDATGAPEPGDHRVEVRARSSYGDITIRRAYSPAGVDLERNDR